LTEFLLHGGYERQLNVNNPLGSKGKLIRAFAGLIDEMWHGTRSVFSPSNFKSAMGRYKSCFQGYQQHDSQELISQLIDGLHEDVN